MCSITGDTTKAGDPYGVLTPVPSVSQVTRGTVSSEPEAALTLALPGPLISLALSFPLPVCLPACLGHPDCILRPRPVPLASSYITSQYTCVPGSTCNTLPRPTPAATWLITWVAPASGHMGYHC